MIPLSEQVDAAKMRAKMAIERARDTDDPMALLRVNYFINDLWLLHQASPILLQGRIETILKGLARDLKSVATVSVATVSVATVSNATVSNPFIPNAIQIAMPTQDMSIPNATYE